MGIFYLLPETFHARFPVSVKSLQFWPKICRPAADIESSIHPQGVSPSQEDRKELLITGKSERMGFWIV